MTKRDFFGSDLTTVECEHILHQRLPKRHYEGIEAKLFETKWFDYFDLHPVQATHLFAHLYVEALQAQLRIRLDYRRAGSISPIKEEDIFDTRPSLYKALWKARQAADSIGVPYDFYCHRAMELGEAEDWLYLPLPNQLFSDRLKSFVQDAWNDALTARVILPKHAFFQTSNYVGNPTQVRLQRFLVDLIKRRQHRQYLTYDLHIRKGILLAQTIIDNFGEDMLGRAISLRQEQ